MTIFWINGQPAGDIPANDRGLAYGDGVFETIKVVSGKLTLPVLHWQRLCAGTGRLRISLDSGLLQRECADFLRDNGFTEGILKIIVTRGSGGRGYNPFGCDQARRILSFHPLPSYPSSLSVQGTAIRLCQHRSGHSLLAGIKHLNRLDQVLARAEWHDTECYEGLMMDLDDRIIEGTMTNVFLVMDDGMLVTPALNHTGVAGVARAYILQEAVRWGVSVVEKPVMINTLEKACEVFLVNSVNGVWPVIACGHLRWEVGTVTRMVRDKIAGVLNA